VPCGKVNKDVLAGFVALALVGLVLGLRFRFPAVLAGSCLLACSIAIFASFSGWSIGKTVGWLAGLLFTLQIGYGLGLWLSTGLAKLIARCNRDNRLDPGR
jgi:hypothetical protein